MLGVIDLVNQSMYSTVNSTHSTMTTVAKYVYDDFSTPSSLRSARVIVEGRSVFVNPGWLAEFSNFFATMFFGKNAGENLILSNELRASVLLVTRMLRYTEQVGALALEHCWKYSKGYQYMNLRECSGDSSSAVHHPAPIGDTYCCVHNAVLGSKQ
ncbi:hypothetical protein LOAG_01509 [Loa loa]|uniref:BTB domain-containing protein n=1 Tax=Loa loa TaxID=7209 RepID=A0A1I7VUY6_LOALO|nr:hypothetical protein LOAG_01509 [Loa loa]EFO26974.1 hypothetical protein LOAG_01509 [Loa loa]